jgi:ATP-dependent exoDNAse (exonuclease V) alpha subunit
MLQTQALTILKTGKNVFLTGEPGSGKTYVINQYISYLRSHGIEPAITASTGIAATHIGGMTIHSWSGIGIKNSLSSGELNFIATNDYVKKRVSSADILIIDEISMLPPDTLNMIDLICKEVKKNQKPFGGMQVVLVGDFFQLPPVAKSVTSDFSQENFFDKPSIRFAYDSPIWQQAEFTSCYITEQYRQDDNDLISLLSKIRNNEFDEPALAHIENRKIDSISVPNNVPKLYSHNVDVDAVNYQMLDKIIGETQYYPMKTKGHEALVNVMKKGCLSPENLYLKIGASIMFTKNNQKDGFVNGTLGVVEGFDPQSNLPIIKIRSGRKIKADYADWAVEEDGKIKGKLSQIPIRLAWAITVHKSQGISLDEAVIDLSRVFEFGQGYVAISRVKRLSGVYILGWNERAFQVDPEVLKKDIEFRDFSIDEENIINTFSDSKINKLQEDFITSCGGEINVLNVIPKSKKKKQSTHNETLKLYNDGFNVSLIAEIRKLSETTILCHIEDLVNTQKINKSDVARIIPEKILIDLPKIITKFKDLGTDRLSPIFEHFNGKYSFDELKIIRMTIK